MRHLSLLDLIIQIAEHQHLTGRGEHYPLRLQYHRPSQHALSVGAWQWSLVDAQGMEIMGSCWTGREVVNAYRRGDVSWSSSSGVPELLVENNPAKPDRRRKSVKNDEKREAAAEEIVRVLCKGTPYLPESGLARDVQHNLARISLVGLGQIQLLLTFKVDIGAATEIFQRLHDAASDPCESFAEVDELKKAAWAVLAWLEMAA